MKQILLSILLLSGCASVPQWSENPKDCSYEEGFSKDVVNGINKVMSRKYICVEQPTVVKLPSFLELLQLPPADEKPVVAVYKFTVLIRSIIFLTVYIFLVSQYISVVTFIPIALVIVMIISVFVLSGRENITELNSSLENINNIDNLK